MHEAYAQALWKMVDGGAKPKEAVVKLRAHLSTAGRMGLFPRIARAFSRLAERYERVNNLVLTVARKKDEASALRAAKKHLADVDIETKGITLQLDESLVGGWRLEGKGILLDASYRKQLLSLYNLATK